MGSCKSREYHTSDEDYSVIQNIFISTMLAVILDVVEYSEDDDLLTFDSLYEYIKEDFLWRMKQVCRLRGKKSSARMISRGKMRTSYQLALYSPNVSKYLFNLRHQLSWMQLYWCRESFAQLLHEMDGAIWWNLAQALGCTLSWRAMHCY